MNTINPLANAQFPASSNTWDFVKEMVLLVSKLASLGGNNYILSGCVDSGNSVTAGIIIANGEILPFEGGAKSDNVIIIETITGVNASGVNYPGIFTTRSARFGGGVGQIAWNTFLPFTPLSLKANAADVYTIEQTNQLITNLVNSAPAVLDTLKELADALGSDPNFATTVATQLGLKANNADVYTKSEIQQRDGGIRTIIYEIGAWNMMLANDHVIGSGNLVTPDKIVGMRCFVRNDSDAIPQKYPLDFVSISTGHEHPEGRFYMSNSFFNMTIRNDGFFKSMAFWRTDINRGWIILDYLP